MVIILGFFTAFFIVLLSAPSLIKVAKLKHLVDEPGEERKLHHKSVPTIGGIIIFAAIVFAYALWFPSENRNQYFGTIDTYGAFSQAVGDFKYIIACLILLFFIGVKDDIIGTAPVKKLFGHIIVGFVLVMMADIRITSMHGLFGIYILPDWASVMLSLFTYIVIVNAFNLIDGVDGLAAGIGLINSALFGTYFYLAGDITLAILAFILAGALLGFLFFNFAPARLFMGDSGSLIIGLIISVLAIKVVEHGIAIADGTSQLHPDLQRISPPVFAMATLVYPLVDTLRIFTYRAIKGMSPFSADKNHIHHRLIKLGLNHAKTVLLLYLFNMVVVATAVLVSMYCNLSSSVVFAIALGVAIILVQIPFFIKTKASA